MSHFWKIFNDCVFAFLVIALIFLLTVFIVSTGCNAQNVYVTKYPWQADQLVYVVDHRSQADNKVYVCKYNWEVDHNVWRFVKHKWQADRIWFVTKHKWKAQIYNEL